MPAEAICPQCSSANVVFSKKRGVHFCEDCGHELAPQAAFVPKRLFISYGHDEHLPLAQRLRDDLKTRGHDVWFDADRLKPGHDWEKSIEQGLEHLAADRANAAVLLVLTPHSVRRPDGYCLNEIARALARGLRIIPLMVVESEPPLSICRVQWLDLRACVPVQDKEALYLPRFQQLLAAVEENRLDFEGTQGRLLGALQPIQFSADILRLLRDFTGRKWVFDEVDAWLNNPAGGKIFWITGAPGFGKSSIAAWIRDHRREVAAFHFCDINSEEKRNPAKLVRSIVYQLATQLPEYQARLALLPLESIVQEYHEAYTLFDKLLIQPLADNFPPPDHTVVVLIDALDEATYQRQNEIVRFLSLCAEKTPPWLRFLLTSRPEPEIIASFQKLSPYILNTSRTENLDDLRTFLQAKLPAITNEQSAAILERSEGVFLYVRHVVEGIQSGQFSLRRLDEFPRGLGAIYQDFFNRQFGSDLSFYEERITPLLQPILAAFEPLTLGLLKRLRSPTTDTELGRCLNRLGSLFPASGERESATIHPFHRSLCDWITSRETAGHFSIAVSDGHRVLAERGWQQFVHGPETMEDYFLQWLPSHLLALGDDDRLVRLLRSFRYLMEKAKRDGLERLLEDFINLPSRLAGTPTQLEIEASFFREKTHILRRGNFEWPAHKILLQLAIEHADDSPLTAGAEQFVTDNRCDWLWLRSATRPTKLQKNPCLAVLEGHTATPEGAIVLPDGRILSWSSDHTLRIWDTSGNCRAVLVGHSGFVFGATVLKDGRILSWSQDTTLRIWDIISSTQLMILEGHSDWVIGALIMPDGRILSWSADSTLRMWDLDSGKPLGVLQGHSERVDGALVMPSGRILSWSWDNTLRIWDSENGIALAILQGHSSCVERASILPDGRILSWSWDGRLRVWVFDSGEPSSVLEGHNGMIKGMLLLSDSRVLSWSNDTTLRIWDINTAESIAILTGHLAEVKGALLLPDGRILSWSNDKTLRIWDGNSGKLLSILEGHSDKIEGALLLVEGSILSWSWDGTARLWDPRDGEELTVIKVHSSAIIGALVLPDESILSWSFDMTLRRWSPDSRTPSTSDEGHESAVLGTLALPNGKVLTRSSHDKTLRLWDAERGQLFAILEGHSDEISGVLALPDGRVLSWSKDNNLRIWDCTSGKSLAVLEGHNRWVSGALILDNKNVLSWSFDRTLRIWNSITGKCLAVLEGHTDWVNRALIMPDSRILSWSSDKTLRIWDPDSGQSLATLEGHSENIFYGARLIPGGKILSWSNDKTLRTWNLTSGAPLSVFEGHSDGVKGALVLSSNRILSWSNDRTLRIWNSDSGKCLAVLEGHLRLINEALVLPCGNILSWSLTWTDDHSLRLWSGDRGICLERVSPEEAAKRHPEWLHAITQVEHPDSIVADFHAARLIREAQLRHRNTPSPLASWNADARSITHRLLPDGTIVAGHDNGQVNFLKLHLGNRRISLAEVETILSRQLPDSGLAPMPRS